MSAVKEPAVPSLQRRLPEILAPAGTEEMMKAAVENGADAIYFGLELFNARLRAANFTREDLPRIMAWLHERGVKGYVTMNTLIFNGELEEAAAALRSCSDAGVDAVLIQDLGLAALAKEMVPGLPVHASTQMTVTCSESILALERLGLNLERVVVARENSRRDLERITRETDKEIEVFVHGAICVAYSGQCLTSEALGGRSANRGECAQACRLPYDLMVDGQPREVDGLKYLLSPKDLAAYEDIGELVNLGIASLKIEGRLKSPQYVAATVQSYRAALEQVVAGEAPHMEPQTREKLAMTFSRGFTGGYLHAVDHQAVVEGRFPKKRGLMVGRVAEVRLNGVLVEMEGSVKPGDGLVFDSGNPSEEEEGGFLFEIFRNGMPQKDWDGTRGDHGVRLELRFQTGRLKLKRINVGDLVWKTSDARLDAELASSYEGDKIRHRRPVTATVTGRVGAPLTLKLVDGDGLSVTVEDTAPADEALNRPLDRDRLVDQLGRMGNTPFMLGDLEARLEGNIMVPMSRLNDLRRRAVEGLMELRHRRGKGRPVNAGAMEKVRAAKANERTITQPVKQSQLGVLCRTLEQVRAAVAHGDIHTIYTDFEDIRLHREARELIPAGGPRFVPATLRVVKPGEAGFVKKLLEAKPDAILLRNLASWVILKELAPELPMLGDYSLNVANDLTARLIMRQNIESLVPSYDLNIDQLIDLLRGAPPSWFEVTLHQYMPMFHMEHCVFCRFLSDGTDYTNCGRPCETHQVSLRDRMGYEHALKADAGCRNTVFNATAQSASAYLSPLLELGVRRYRIDFLREDEAQVASAINLYLPAIRGEIDGSAIWKSLRATSKLGVTRGSLDHE